MAALGEPRGGDNFATSAGGPATTLVAPGAMASQLRLWQGRYACGVVTPWLFMTCIPLLQLR